MGATGVLLGAFGTHGLRDVLLERGMSNAWETAVRYHLLHALGLLALGIWLRLTAGTARQRIGWAARCWTVGSILFSGSLYGFALGGPHWLVFVTPIGGAALVAGWLCVIAAAIAKEE